LIKFSTLGPFWISLGFCDNKGYFSQGLLCRGFLSEGYVRRGCFSGIAQSSNRSYKTFLFFGIILGHFTKNKFLLYLTNTKAYQGKTEKFFVSKEKKFYRICSWAQFHQRSTYSFHARRSQKCKKTLMT